MASSTRSEWEQHFAAFAPLPGNLEEPLALRYHGHQFRVYNPHLGDGRGFLYAQLLDAQDGRLPDLGTKGSGPRCATEAALATGRALRDSFAQAARAHPRGEE